MGTLCWGYRGKVAAAPLAWATWWGPCTLAGGRWHRVATRGLGGGSDAASPLPSQCSRRR